MFPAIAVTKMKVVVTQIGPYLYVQFSIGGNVRVCVMCVCVCVCVCTCVCVCVFA